MSFLGIFSCFPDMIHRCFGAEEESMYLEVNNTHDELSDACRPLVSAAAELRGAFSELELPYAAPLRGHTHGVAAAKRSSASAFADILGEYTARRPVFFQMSKTDQRKGRTGVREYHWGKDLNAEARNIDSQKDDMLVLVDVDYYLDDLPGKLSKHGKPALIYTFQPSAAAKAEGDTHYTFNKDQTVSYTVGGGGKYSHRVWNFDGDSFSHTGYGCFGCVPTSFSVFSLERKMVDPDHQLILAAPMGLFKGYFQTRKARKHAQAKQLARLAPVKDGFIRLQIKTDTGVRVSTARAGGYLAAEVSTQVDEAISLVAETTKLLSHATVVSKMSGAGSVGKPPGSEVLLAYHQVRSGKVKINFGPVEEKVSMLDAVHSYQYVPTMADYEPGTPSMVAFMNPLVDGAYVPERGLNNDRRTHETRVRQPQLDAKKSGNSPSPHVMKCMKEFCELLGEIIGTNLSPVDYETVFARQNRPTQRAILEEAEHQDVTQTARAMQKAEAYQTANDPRNITIMDGVNKREHSKFMYALYDMMANVPWYAFGKKPKDIAQAMADLCLIARWWADSDFSRQDGNIGALVRIFEMMLMLHLFGKEHHAEIRATLRAQTFLNVKTRFGVKYNSGFSRASGSPETAVFNTILTAFIMFLAFRMSRKTNGAFYTAREAWDALGLYGGDDGGTPDLDPKKAEKAAVIMGQKLEILVVNRGEVGVQFLARHYGPNVWFGDSNSCCDIKRQLSKFHVTPHLNKVTPLGKLVEKSFAFSLCDSGTPVIGQLVRRALELEGFTRADYKNALGIWNSDLSQSDHYPNEHDEWMDDLLEKQFAGGFDRAGFEVWCTAAGTANDLLVPMVFHRTIQQGAHPARPGTVVIDGEVVTTEGNDGNAAPVAQDAAGHAAGELPAQPNATATRRRNRQRLFAAGEPGVRDARPAPASTDARPRMARQPPRTVREPRVPDAGRLPHDGPPRPLRRDGTSNPRRPLGGRQPNNNNNRTTHPPQGGEDHPIRADQVPRRG